MSFNKQSAADMIQLILHGVLEEKRYNASNPMPFSKHGAVFVVRHKEDMGRAVGRIMTSEEAVLSGLGASHWTPNVYRYGQYEKINQYLRVMKGSEEDNLKAINAFVVDVDFPEGAKPGNAWDFDFRCFDVQLKHRLLSPNMILDTPHGYQAYYILDAPVWLKRDQKGNLPALAAAKHISTAIRAAVAKQEPHTDCGANHFGFFRMPSATNIIDVDEDDFASFAELQEWSLSLAPEKATYNPADQQGNADQMHTSWFKALATADVDAMKQGGLARNNTLLTLLLAMYSSQKSYQEASEFADRWNANQTEPLVKREVRSTLKSAYSGRYKGAQLAYVKELCALYAPELKIKATGHAWKHVERPREDRKYSHLTEWGVDLVHLAEVSTDRVKGHARFTVDQLTRELKISRNTLTRLLDKMQTSGVFSVQRIRGRKGCILIATSSMIEDYVRTEKLQTASERREMLKDKNPQPTAKAPFMVEQLDLFYTFGALESPPPQRC